MSVPKLIHYCWFGNNLLPLLAKKCISSWKKYCPDYKIIEWNQNNFDVNVNSYAKEAYEAKKFAFVTDYVRLFALYHYGGIYMDIDVEVMKPIDVFLKHRAFTGCENEKFCVTGIMAAEKKHPWIKQLLDEYSEKHFILPNGSFDTTPNPRIITRLTIDEYNWIPENRFQILKDGLYIYPSDVFCANDYRTGRIKITNNTYTVHHFLGSWVPKSVKLKTRVKTKIIDLLGPKATKVAVNFKKKINLLRKNLPR